MAGEKVKLSRAERLDAQEQAALRKIDEIRDKRAMLKVAGDDRKIADRKKFVIGAVVLAGVAKGEKSAINALEWIKGRLTEPRDKKLFGLDLTDAEIVALEFGDRKRSGTGDSGG